MSAGSSAGRSNFIQINELPTFKLGTIGEVQIFGQCIGLPITASEDARFTPNSGSSIKIDKETGLYLTSCSKAK